MPSSSSSFTSVASENRAGGLVNCWSVSRSSSVRAIAHLERRQADTVLGVLFGDGGVGDLFGLLLLVLGAVHREPAREALDLALGLEHGLLLVRRVAADSTTVSSIRAASIWEATVRRQISA